MSRYAFFVFMIVAVSITGCASIGQSAALALPAGDARRGQALFLQASIRDTSGCVQCHSLERDKIVVGPSLWGVSTRAERTIHSSTYLGTATTADEYLREAITRPDASIVPGFAHSVMPDWLTVLDEQQIQDLVAYLMTLRE
jgi:mono/diheme cytochrome c family protein